MHTWEIACLQAREPGMSAELLPSYECSNYFIFRYSATKTEEWCLPLI